MIQEKNIELKVDKELLKSLIDKHSVTIYILGIKGFGQKVINARLLFEELHLIADCDKETFIDYVNVMKSEYYSERERYVRIPEVDELFLNIEFEGMFKTKGHEELNNDPFIRHKNLSLYDARKNQ